MKFPTRENTLKVIRKIDRKHEKFDYTIKINLEFLTYNCLNKHKRVIYVQ